MDTTSILTEGAAPDRDIRLDQEIASIRDSGLLSTKSRERSLFDYLAAHAGSSESVKESVLAAEAFGQQDFSSSDNAVVRVYVHRLRKKLDDYYAGVGSTSGYRLTLPRGEYRLVLTKAAQPAAGATVSAVRRPTAHLLLVGAMAGILFSALVWVVVLADRGNDAGAPPANALSPLLASSDRPIYIVIGDYYMFAQSAPDSGSHRLVRVFDVNSRGDLEVLLLNHPEQYPESFDIGLTYLPPSILHALSDLIPVVDQTGRRYEVMKMSAAKPDILASGDVIYMGLISGMGFLRDVAFGTSHFVPGDNYDEIINLDSNEYYRSTEAVGHIDDKIYLDYGYFQLTRSDPDRMLLIIAGTRDTGLRGLSNLLARPNTPQTLLHLESKRKFEALVQIEGRQQAIIQAEIIGSSETDGNGP